MIAKGLFTLLFILLSYASKNRIDKVMVFKMNQIFFKGKHNIKIVTPHMVMVHSVNVFYPVQKYVTT